MVIFTSLILLTVTLVPNERKAGRIAYFFLYCWGISFSTLCLIFYKVHGSDKVDRSETYIFASNHSSFLDGIAICLAIRNDFRPLGKIELLKIPVFGLMYKYVVILIDRKSPESRQKSFHEMLNKLKAGISVLIFPEGTMNQSKQVLQPFHNGAFALAIESQKSIVPMAIINTNNCMPRNPKYTLKPGIIHIHFMEPVSIESSYKKDIENLKAAVYNKIESKLLSEIK